MGQISKVLPVISRKYMLSIFRQIVFAALLQKLSFCLVFGYLSLKT